MGDPVALVKRFYDAFLADDFETVAALLDQNVFWHIDGTTVISGEYRGRDAVIGLFRRIKALTDGTFRPAGPKTWDILTSEHHVALMDLFLGTRAGKSLNSHEAWVMHLRGGRITEGFHYVESLSKFTSFWS